MVSVDGEGGILVWSMPDSSQYAHDDDYEIETKYNTTPMWKT